MKDRINHWIGNTRPAAFYGVLGFACLLAILVTGIVTGQVFNRQPANVEWVDDTGTNALQLQSTASSGPRFKIVQGGKTNFTAITTNYVASNLTGNGASNTFQIVNGLIVGVSSNP